MLGLQAEMAGGAAVSYAVRRLRVLGVGLAAAFTASAAEGADKDWMVIVSPYFWGASLGGDIGLAGLQSDIHLPFSEIFDHLDLAAMGNVEVVRGRWGAYLDAQYVKTSQQEQVLSAPVDLEIRTTRVMGGVFYKAGEVLLGGETVYGRPRTVSLEPTIGLRWTDLDARAAIPGLVQTQKGADWVDPFVGARINADLSRRWNLFVEGDLGGFGAGSSISVHAQAYLGYRTWLLKRPTILRAGYRFIQEDYSQTDFTGRTRFTWDVRQHGPGMGLSMIF